MRRLSRGFSLIDVVVGVALLLLLFLALFGVLRASLVLSTLAKAKAAGIEVANTQMEYLRGLSYDVLGTVGGIPAGPVPQVATSTVDGVIYVTRTYIQYQDDPADNTGASDTNHVTTDYKEGKVTVSYAINGLAKAIILVSKFVPPGIESSTGGGTLSLHVVGAYGANLGDAIVHIVNTATNPTVDLSTFTDTSGFVLLGGVATSSQYQIFVSRSGYSSAQTYARTAQNVNPTPGYLTVAKDQTTPGTFQIDLLATLTLMSFSPATTTMFSDSFADTSKLASQTDTRVSGGSLILTDESLSGSALSNSIAPTALDGWGVLSATLSTPSGTSLVVHVDDGSGTPLPDAVLAGNIAGFSSFPVSLTGIATSSYPVLKLEANLTSEATTTTPSLLDWSFSHTEGPIPFPNLSFTLTGAKTIGTDSGDLPIYKTTVSDSTGATASKTETLEWDAYALTLPSASLIESCPASPYALAPAQASSTALIIGSQTANTLPLIIETTASTTIAGAVVVLAKSGYAATVPTSACGLAYFGGLASGTYSATVSATGHATKAFPNISVAGHTATTTLTLP